MNREIYFEDENIKIINNDILTTKEIPENSIDFLYKIKDAKKEGDRNKEYFNLALYYLMKSAEV